MNLGGQSARDVQELRGPIEGYRWRFFNPRSFYLQAGWLLVLAGGRRLKLDGSHIEVMCLVCWEEQTGSNGTTECVLQCERRKKYG